MAEFSSRKSFSSKKSNPLPKSRVIIGRKPLLEALNSGTSIDKVFIQKTAKGEELIEIQKLSKSQQIPVSFVPQEKIEKFTKANHQGVIAIASQVRYHSLQDVIDVIHSNGETPFFLVLDGVTDTRNLGAMARSAHCLGCHAIVLPKSNSAAITDEAIKTSAGALEHIHICREASIEQIMDILHLNGVYTLATHLDGEDMTGIQWENDIPIAVVMGSEDKGVSRYVIKNSKKLICIPQSNNFDSLNVSVAAGIVLFEVFKNRK